MTPYSNSNEKRRVFSFSDENFDDTRIDYDEDKKIDYWKIKRGSLIIETYYRKDKTLFHIRKFDNAQVLERLVLLKNGRMRMVLSANRRQALFNYSKNDVVCGENELLHISSIIESLKTTSIDIPLCTENFLSNECFELSNQEFSDSISKAVESIYKAPSHRPLSKNSALECLSDAKIKKYFIQKFGNEIGEVEYEKVLIGYKKSILRFTRMQEGKSEPVLHCKQTDEKSPSPSMRTSEDGKIQVQVKRNGEKYSVKELEKELFHETLHASSLIDENLTQIITDTCLASGISNIPIITANNQVSGGVVQTASSIVSQANITQAEKNAVVIPASVEAPLPPPSNSSPIDMNRVAAIESTERVQSISNSQSRGIVRMAESVLAATPAVAAPSTTGLASATSGSTSSRLPASTYKASTSAPAAKLLAKQNSNGLKPGEYIKEEIDLTQQSAPTRPRVAANAAEKPTVAASAKNGLSEPATTEVSANSDIASSGSLANPAGRSNDTRLSISSSTGARSPRRGMASSGSAVSQVDFAKSKTGLVTQLSATSNYQKIRAQLDSTEFVQNLKDNSITVYNLQGKTWGAKKGDIIFLDQGDRFVREK